MTRTEFDLWIEQHYQELLKVARRRTNSADEATDALQAGLLQFLANRDLAAIDKPWTFLVNAVRNTAKDGRRGAQRFRALRREHKKVAGAGPSLGCKRTKPAPNAE